ncbi:MAG: hypothetical protein JWN86_1506 [Planctomycetota bacterium]|nr:hypothetical protein [Planctomycetota bacterium]
MDRLAQLQRSLAERADADAEPDSLDRLNVMAVHGQWHIDFYGDPFGEAYEELMSVLALPEVAGSMVSLSLRGPDEGSNGTRNWNISMLAESPTALPRLRSLSLERTRPADHNRSIVARDYDEDGVLAALLAKAPRLEFLESPSAPNAEFFKVGRRPLRFLSVDAGFDHQIFIGNLARSSCFPDLRHLEFGEFAETYMEDFNSFVTPLADYQSLFASPAFAPVRGFVWRNPACSAEDIASLKAIDESRQILVVRWSADWITSR